MAKYTKLEQWVSAGNTVASNSVKIQTGHIVLARYIFWQDFYIKNFNVKKYI
jgi:hypothetical protein